MYSSPDTSGLFDNAWQSRPSTLSIHTSRTPSTGCRSPSTRALTPCSDCEEYHNPRRLVICADGTWMGADGSRANPQGNTSNVHRIWSLLPLKKVVRDEHGDCWEQKRLDYIEGVGISAGMADAAWTAITGRGQTGCDAKIKKIYRECCKLCPPKDEIFMFGFSRGAFVVRAVAGMLQHLGALRLEEATFDTQFDAAMKVWHDLRKGGQNQQYSHTRDSPAIRFLGVFDTVQAFNDSGLNDIGLLDNVFHVRHAMALFESRKAFKLERFSNKENTVAGGLERSCQEAWFLGTHGNLGGACMDDGLALWPLQWILSEAQKFSLALEFTASRNSNIKNPADFIFPGLNVPEHPTLPNVNEQMSSIAYTNGIRVSFCDLSTIFCKAGFAPVVDPGDGVWLRREERQVFDGDGNLIDTVGSDSGSSGVFIHPSVYHMDNRCPSMIRAINGLPYVDILRHSELTTVYEVSRQHWNVTNQIMQLRKIERPRILLCGPSGVGKTTLINAVLGEEVAKVNHGAKPGKHDIEVEVGGPDRPYLLHDSQGWLPGEDGNFQTIQKFLRKRRQMHQLQKQVHCIWFCSASDNHRISPTDEAFLNLDFGQVPVVVVSTKHDILEHNAEREVLRTNFSGARNIRGMTQEQRETAEALIEARVENEKETIKRQWNSVDVLHESLDLTFEFVSCNPDLNISALKQTSTDAMTGDRIRQIHANAQKNFIDKALDEAVDKLVDTWETNRSSIEIRQDQLRVRDFIKTVIKEANEIFNYRGFNADSHPDLFINLLMYSEADSRLIQLINSEVVPALAVGAGVFINPAFFAVSAGIAVGKAHRTAVSLIPALVQIILVFERIYWYDGGEINDRFIDGACCYYLKRQVEISKRIQEVMGWRLNIVADKIRKSDSVVRDILKTVIDEFRFKYSGQLSQEREVSDIPMMPGSFIGGGL